MLFEILKNPKKAIKNFSGAAKEIEKYVKKTTKEIEKGSLLGYFYTTITIVLLGLFGILAVGFILLISSFFPEYMKWAGAVLGSLPVLAIIYFVIKLIDKANKKEK
ncbi:MAG: hypothetical protein Q8R37_01040 [Nanoarchaeota archaeon]|nr:hypothetical protein [Nanoarchaeota archaeon]